MGNPMSLMEDTMLCVEPLNMTGYAEPAPLPSGRWRPERQLSLVGAVLVHVGFLVLLLAAPDPGFRQGPLLPEVVEVSLHTEEPIAPAAAVQPALQREAAPRPAAVTRRDRQPVPAAPVVKPTSPPAAPEVAHVTPVSSSPESGQQESAPAQSSAESGGGPVKAGTAATTGSETAEVPARPRYRDNPPPSYPEQARRLRLEGTVVLEAVVGGGGTVDDLAVHASSGHRLLDDAALRAVRAWLFEPGRRGGIPITMKIMVPVRFALR
jgi:protein TonB